jgi:glycosyltransferase involved in cell wall biosynthesis
MRPGPDRLTMRVLQVVTDTDRRGAQIFAVDLHTALGDRGHTVSTVALAPGSTRPPLELEWLGARRRGPKTLRRLHGLMRTVDVTIAHGSATAAACAASSIGSGTPFVYRQVSDTHFWASTRARRWRVRRYLERAALVVALSGSARDDLIANLALDAEHVRIVPNGVPAARYPIPDAARRREARTSLELGTTPTAVVVSALYSEKGVGDAIEAIAECPGAQLLVVGDGPQRPALERLADERAAGRVRFFGSLASLDDVYAAADVALFPSRGGDSMPAALIEAGLSGLPAVTTSVGASAEVVVDGVTGTVVDPGDLPALTHATRAVFDGQVDVDAYGDAARTRCLEHFEIGVVGAQWEAVLREAIERRR